MTPWLKRKSFLYVTLYIVIMGAIASLLYTRYANLTDAYVQSHVKEFDKRIESYQSMQQRMLDNYYGLFLDAPRVSQIMYEASISNSVEKNAVLRAELYGRMQKVFAGLQKFDTRLLFFHLRGNIGFLRVHEPENFGDDLASVRPGVVKAQSLHKKVVIYETGRFFSGFRSIYPLFNQGNFSGTVEIGYPFLALKKQAMLQDEGAYTILVKRSLITKKAGASVIANEYKPSLLSPDYFEDQSSALEKGAQGFAPQELRTYIMDNREKIHTALKEEKLQGIRLTHKGKSALLVLKPVFQIGGDHAAYIVEITPNHTIFEVQWHQFLALLGSMALLTAFLLWYIYRYNRSVLFTEQYKKAIEESMIVSRTDTKGNITYVNPLFIEISGYTQDELVGQSHSMVRHPDTPESVFKGMWHTLKRGRNWHGMLQNRARNGKSYYVKNLICPIVDENGEILEYLGLREDVTEIQNSRLKAQEAERIKSAFLANMSHEIRTPINGIVGFIHLLSQTGLDTTQRRYVSIVESSLETLLHIINDVLDYSKIEEGKIELEQIESYPKRDLPPAFELFIPQADIKKINYTLMMDEHIENCLVLDILRLKQVISNLISNALKFTPEEGSVNLKIEVAGETEQSQTLRFSVTDTGIGIPEEKQGKIFEKFTQADTSTTRQYGGTGLGLSIAYAMVNLMGGVLEIQSKEGRGSTFSFQITAHKCNESNNGAVAVDKPQSVKLTLRVLVVDDYEINRMLIEEMLSHHYGIEPDFAQNGEEAVNMVEENSYDMVFMDVNMPIMDGIQATRLIRKKHPSLPIIALTANVMRGDSQEFVAAGMNDYLAKPLDYDELHRVMMRYCAVKELK